MHPHSLPRPKIPCSQQRDVFLPPDLLPCHFVRKAALKQAVASCTRYKHLTPRPWPSLNRDLGEFRDCSQQVAVSNHNPCPGSTLQGQEALEIRNRQALIFQHTNWWGRQRPPHCCPSLSAQCPSLLGARTGQHTRLSEPRPRGKQGNQWARGPRKLREAPTKPGVHKDFLEQICFRMLGLVSLRQFLNYAFCGRCF